ncbi:MAG: hypothetical protein IJ040_08040 [Lachnospiraceae bacterium]|nr:hypothetical protein [Lachnospiraceae bacterium]
MNDFLDTREIPMDAQDVEQNKIFAIISYINLLFLVPIFAAKDSAFAKFHANQGLVLFIVTFIVNVINGTICGLLGALHLGWLASIVGPIVGMVMVAFMVVGIINAAKGVAKELPLFGRFHILDSENKEV